MDNISDLQKQAILCLWPILQCGKHCVGISMTMKDKVLVCIRPKRPTRWVRLCACVTTVRHAQAKLNNQARIFFYWNTLINLQHHIIRLFSKCLWAPGSRRGSCCGGGRALSAHDCLWAWTCENLESGSICIWNFGNVFVCITTPFRWTEPAFCFLMLWGLTSFMIQQLPNYMFI